VILDDDELRRLAAAARDREEVVPPTPPVNTVAGLEWVTVRIDASQKRL
jgi:hypothetical protein